jgi:phenylalanyl-tRNA synthetase alpha chain
MVKFETHETLSQVLTPEGSQIAVGGSHEARVWAALPAKGEGAPVTPVQLRKQVGDETAKVGQGRAFKNGWIGKEGDGLVKLVSRVVIWCRFCLICLSYRPLKTSRN